MSGMPDLNGFMLAHGVSWASCQRLMALGVPGRFVAELGARLAIGQARVCLMGGGRFWEPRGPDARVMLACFEGEHLIDIAAFATSFPAEVALATGDGWCLGEDAIRDCERSALAGRYPVLRLVADPLEWLRSGGKSLCVLDWARAIGRLRSLGESVTIECDAGAGEQLKARLKHGGLPRVKERAPVARAREEEAA
ncbi:hypothetical protein [Erythrobacter rubeus]|uniref:Uncharacterized protein n=1 Tax=Erythrobacter rubeus TaxID=2760803 RepID=A0ABR8KPP3_9SPHN|nr:hypothetical protein [Erythrobacter rubeus]MBD2842691.1 hypothetical protein [Erythrobacter rubeus]